MRLLIVEDNVKIASYLKEALEAEGYSVDTVPDGETGERRGASEWYDLIILDLMLPGKDGIEVCRTLRAQGNMLPIIMLTAKGDVDDRVLGLDSGADDYLIKPFEMKELIARVRALLRRPEQFDEKLSAQDITMDTHARTVTVASREVGLTRKEYAVLEYFLRNKGVVLSREQILDHCWDFAFDTFSNIVDVYVRQLRTKLSGGDERHIETVRGLGYHCKA